MDTPVKRPITADLDPRIRHLSLVNLRKLFPSISQYEVLVLSLLLAAREPLTAQQMAFFTRVPRTKVYGVLNRLTEAGLAETVIFPAEELELPGIWEYWPKNRQTAWLKERGIGTKRWVAVRSELMKRFAMVEQDYKRLAGFVWELKEVEA